MNAPIEPDTTIMTRMATMMAATMISICRTRPTAVNTESSENTMSMSAICTTTAVRPPCSTRGAGVRLRALERLVDLEHALAEQEQAASRTGSRRGPRSCSPAISNHGAVRRVSHTIENSSAMRVTIASARPPRRATFCCRGGRRATRMEMKMMLSMPRTISSSDSVTNASQMLGSANRAAALRYGR